MGSMLAAGLTLRHYAAFAEMRSLVALKERVGREMPDYERWGIHVMANQNGLGELVLGDSHVYGAETDGPFDSDEIDRLVLDYLGKFLRAPDLRIAERWHGIYAKNRRGLLYDPSPAPGVRLFTGLSGMGMTLSFGLAEAMWEGGGAGGRGMGLAGSSATVAG
jgi:D-hydroxyproline dehydrogenase subunit beta